VSTSTTTAVWSVAVESTSSATDQLYLTDVPLGGSVTCGPYTLSGASTSAVCSGLVSSIGSSCSLASAAACARSSTGYGTTLTAKTTGAAGNFIVEYGPPTTGGTSGNIFDTYLSITNTTKGQGPNYVSGITITTAGSGYQPETPITLGGPGTGAVAVANTSIGTAAQSYQPAYGAAPGYDLATGLGSVNAYNMVNNCVWTSNCPANTTTAVSSSANPSGYGEAVSFTATVTGNSPTGTVQFNVDGSAFGSPVTLSGGSATSGSTTTLTVGTHTVTAVYSGDSANHGSTGTLSGGQVVTTAGAEVTVQSSGSPSAYGQNVTFTATINGQYGEIQHNTKKGTPLTVTGTVTWSSNTGCGPTNVTSTGPGSATATCQTAMLPVGSSDQVTANYSGDSNHTPGSGFIDQAVTVAATAISVTNVNPSSVDYGSTAPVAISASLSWSGSGAAPTAADVTISGSAGLNGSFGATSCSAPSGDTMACNGTYTPSGTEAMGTYTMSAAFSGDGNYSASSSTGTNNFTINTATSSTTVTSSGSPSSYGSSVTFTATIDGENGSIKKGRTVHKGVKSDNVTGTVTWSSNTGCSASTVSGYPGVATCTTSSLAVGTDTVTASYGGDSNHQPSSGSFNQVVSGGAGTSINVTSVSPAAEDYGSTTPVAITAVLSWTGSGAAPTASDVSISGSGLSGSFGATSCGAPSSDTITCTNTYSPSGSDAAGSYTISAAFSGDSNYGPSNSPQAGNFTINLATTTTGVVGNPNPSTYAQSVTFTATINAENGNVAKRPARKGVKSQDVSGTVTWSSNTGCSPSTVSGYPGVATCTTSSSTRLPVGTDTVTATYSGDSNHSGSTGSENQVVQGGIATTISVTGVSPSSESYGQDAAVTITAQLTWTGNGKEPTKSDVTISGNGNGTYGATTCGTRSGDTITCTATYTPTAADNVGSYTETAAFSGDSIYSASSSSQVNNFSITQATQTITAAPPPGVKTKDSFTVSATGGGSGNPLTYSSGGDCTNSGATYTAGTRAGSCLGTINQAGNTNYSAATPYTFTVAVATTLAPSGATLTGAPSSAIGGSTFVVTATYPNTPGVPEEVPTITAAGACTVGSASGSGNTYQATVTVIKGSGTCTTTAKWAANFYYAAATADEKTTAEETTPNTTFTGAPTSAIGGSSFVVTATSDESGTYASVPTITAAGACSAGTASSNGPGSYQATITMTKGSGTCTTKAEWAKSIAYAAATDEQTTTAEITTPTFGFTGAPGSAAEGTTFTVTATSNETGTYAVAPKITAAGSCTAGAVVNQGSGTYTSLITVTKASGTCTTTAKWAASIEYAADTLTQNTAATAATE
jgi:large repetitive protein